jgi:hypothetical protein
MLNASDAPSHAMTLDHLRILICGRIRTLVWWLLMSFVSHFLCLATIVGYFEGMWRKFNGLGGP